MPVGVKAEDELPWGWWLRVARGALEDDEGRRWPSVRAALWHGHLNLPDSHVTGEQQELLLRVLASVHGRGAFNRETGFDLLGGDLIFWQFYRCWLASIGLLEVGSNHQIFDAPLSSKGRSVLLMLQATREAAWEERSFENIVDAISSKDTDDVDRRRDEAIRSFERDVANLPHVFARERVGRLHLVTLTGMSIEARMPTRRVMWSHAFTDERSRDDFFAWLAQRADRWDDWGRMAYGQGSASLTAHLLTLFIERRDWRP